jgi:hypothetical protein
MRALMLTLHTGAGEVPYHFDRPPRPACPLTVPSPPEAPTKCKVEDKCRSGCNTTNLSSGKINLRTADQRKCSP